MEIKKISVLGAGVMGHEIAQVCAQSGFQVILRGRTQESVQAVRLCQVLGQEGSSHQE